MNSKVTHPAGKVIHTIFLDSHSIEYIIDAHKNGDTQILGR